MKTIVTCGAGCAWVGAGGGVAGGAGEDCGVF